MAFLWHDFRAFLLYILSMEKKLLNIANKELQKLESVQNPTWETFEKMAMLYCAKKYLEEIIEIDIEDIGDGIEKLREYYGAERTLDIVSLVLREFRKDLDMIAPHLGNVLENKFKEYIKNE